MYSVFTVFWLWYSSRTSNLKQANRTLSLLLSDNATQFTAMKRKGTKDPAHQTVFLLFQLNGNMEWENKAKGRVEAHLNQGKVMPCVPASIPITKNSVTWEIEMVLIQLLAAQTPYTIINNASQQPPTSVSGEVIIAALLLEAMWADISVTRGCSTQDMSDKAQAHQDWNRAVLGTNCFRS